MPKRKTPEDIANHLSAALAQGDSTKFTIQLMELVKERGMTAISRKSGVSRYSLYRYVAGTDRPLLETAVKMTAACGLKLQVVPQPDEKSCTL